MKIRQALKNTSILALTFALMISGQIVSAMDDDRDDNRRASLKSSSSSGVVSQIDWDDVENQEAQAAAAAFSNEELLPIDADHLERLQESARNIEDMSRAGSMTFENILRVLKEAYYFGMHSKVLAQALEEERARAAEAAWHQRQLEIEHQEAEYQRIEAEREEVERQQEAATAIQRMVRGHLVRKEQERAAEARRQRIEAERIEAEYQRELEAERRRVEAEVEAEHQRAAAEAERQRLEREEAIRKQLELECIEKEAAVRPFVEALKRLMEERLMREMREYPYFEQAYQAGLKGGLSASGYTLDRMRSSLRDHLRIPNEYSFKSELEGMVKRLLQQTGPVSLRDHVIAVLGLKPVEREVGWRQYVREVPVDLHEAPLLRVFSGANASAMQDAISKLFGSSSSAFAQYMYDIALNKSIAEHLAKMGVK